MIESLLWGLLAYGVLPVWLLAGLSDYLLHARTRLAQTSGVRESAMHLLQTAEIGLPMLALLFLEVNALTLAVMILGALAHTYTAYRDIHYATPLRRISAFEQFVHAFLIVLPLAALGIILVLHWPALTSLFGLSETPSDGWHLHWRDPAFDMGVIFAILGASFLFAILPGLIEFINALRQHARTSPDGS